jgi:lipoprotein-anchoring transpeptidase ErfK/SrfK
VIALQKFLIMFFYRKREPIKLSPTIMTMRAAAIILVFTLAGIMSFSCAENPGATGIYTLADEAGSIIRVPEGVSVAGEMNKASSTGQVHPDKPGNMNLDTEEDLTDEDSIGGNGVNEDEEEENFPEEDSVVDGDVQEQEGLIEMEEENSVPEVEDDATVIDFNDAGSFRIEVDLLKQVTYVFYKDELVKEMICSGGTEEKPTPPGEFTTTQKENYFWSDKYSMGAYYWIRFYKEYLFHSVPFDADNVMIAQENEKLGSPASHGCIRLGLEDAKWMYEMLPLGIKVLIY